MGMYDELPGGSQVKLWDCLLRSLDVGSVVNMAEADNPHSPEAYVVLLAEGGYVRVFEDVIVEIVEDGQNRTTEEFDLPCFNKWGLSGQRQRKEGTPNER